MTPKDSEPRPESETVKRRDDALRRALSTPHKPQASESPKKQKPGGSPAKKRRPEAGR
jgi:hypothetical protein